MAMIARNKDGSFASDCAICGNQLTEPIFATSHFIGDRTHDLYRFSDAAMHWDCYLKWPHQARFASMYFEALKGISESTNRARYWTILLKSSDLLVQYGHVPNEISIALKKSGTDIRVAREDWRGWLKSEWRQQCRPGVEYDAVESSLDLLSKLELPPPSQGQNQQKTPLT